jgi:MoxR-like ATPase
MLQFKISPKYEGKPIPPEEWKKAGLAPYLPSPELVNAVKLAIFLEKRPLLLQGEPGCGKTRLAEAVAFELGLLDSYYPWYIKSTSRAKDGLYTYDAVRRLYDAQLARHETADKSAVENLNNYIKLGAVGRAFTSENRSIILIDEIDKADIDFPNDLLRELDEQRFTIEETGETIAAKYPPIVFITSNRERDLPEAFLRRCLFYSIEFPSDDQLKKIVLANFTNASPEVVTKAVERFRELRETLQKKKASKSPSTSELIDWFGVVNEFPEEEAFKLLGDKLLPFTEVLLKNWDDRRHYLNP